MKDKQHNFHSLQITTPQANDETKSICSSLKEEINKIIRTVRKRKEIKEQTKLCC
jgi:hypothetical protein